MSKLWLTYAWKDNEENDVDHIISQLRAAGVDVSYDRAQLLVGRRLWEQISAAIVDPEIEAWAIYASENSLQSEPCQEELAYALDRALRTRGSRFPLIGLFSGDFDPSLVPSALATRLCVNLHSNEWVRQVRDGLEGTKTAVLVEPLKFGHQLHEFDGHFVLEVWPRTGTWTPTQAVVSEDERDLLENFYPSPRGLTTPRVVAMTCGQGTQNGLFGRVFNNPVNSATTAHIRLKRLPRWIEFGPAGKMHRIDFERQPSFNVLDNPLDTAWAAALKPEAKPRSS